MLYLGEMRLLILLLLLPCFSFGQITFQKTYGGLSFDYGYDLDVCSDGGYIITGSIIDTGAAADPDLYLMKTDEFGEIIWNKTFDREGGSDYGRAVEQTFDGGYIVVGNAGYTGPFGADVFVIKTDENGDTLWTRTFGTDPFEDWGTDVKQLSDSGYIITGGIGTPPMGWPFDLYLIRLNSSGDTLWTGGYGGAGRDIGWSVYPTNDNGFIVMGERYFTCLKTDSNGVRQWMRALASFSTAFAYAGVIASDGNYVLTGECTACGGGPDADILLLKVDQNGDTLWAKNYEGSNGEQAWALSNTADGGYIIGGKTQSFGAGGWDAYLIKTDSIGDTLWTRVIGGTGWDEVQSIQQTTDGGYIMVGWTSSFGIGSQGIFLIKTDENGKVGCNALSTSPIVTTPITSDSTTLSGDYFGSLILGSQSNIINQIIYDSTLCDTCFRAPLIGFSFIDSLLVVNFTNSSLGGANWYWDFGDGNNDTIQNPIHTYASAGTYWVCLYATNSCGTDSICDSITVTDVGINEYSKEQFTIYPNPSSGEARIMNAEQGITNIEVFDLFGRPVPFHFDIGRSLLDIRSSPPGIYFVRVGGAVRKLVKQ